MQICHKENDGLRVQQKHLQNAIGLCRNFRYWNQNYHGNAASCHVIHVFFYFALNISWCFPVAHLCTPCRIMGSTPGKKKCSLKSRILLLRWPKHRWSSRIAHNGNIPSDSLMPEAVLLIRVSILHWYMRENFSSSCCCQNYRAIHHHFISFSFPDRKEIRKDPI